MTPVHRPAYIKRCDGVRMHQGEEDNSIGMSHDVDDAGGQHTRETINVHESSKNSKSTEKIWQERLRRIEGRWNFFRIRYSIDIPAVDPLQPARDGIGTYISMQARASSPSTPFSPQSFSITSPLNKTSYRYATIFPMYGHARFLRNIARRRKEI